MKKTAKYLFVAAALVASASSFAQVQQITGGPWLGCKDKDTQGHITKMAVSGDTQAFQKAVVKTLLSGDCVQLKAGQQVFLEDTAIFSGLIKIRRQGDTAAFWTNIEALGKK